MSCGDRCNVSHLHLGKTLWNPISGQRTTKEKGQEEERWQKSSPMNGDDKGDKKYCLDIELYDDRHRKQQEVVASAPYRFLCHHRLAFSRCRCHPTATDMMMQMMMC